MYIVVVSIFNVLVLCMYIDETQIKIKLLSVPKCLSSYTQKPKACQGSQMD